VLRLDDQLGHPLHLPGVRRYVLSGRLPVLCLAVAAATALGVAAALVAVVSRSESGSPARVPGRPAGG